MPGKSTVVLTADGQSYTQALTVQMDPRVKTSQADLQKQFDLSSQLYADLLALQPVVEKSAAARAQIKAAREKASGAEAAKLDEASKQLETMAGGGGRRRRGQQTESLEGVQSSMMELFTMLQEVDLAPTAQAAESVPKLRQSAAQLIEQWKQFEGEELSPLKLQP
jgi:hypothetical protein